MWQLNYLLAQIHICGCLVQRISIFIVEKKLNIMGFDSIYLPRLSIWSNLEMVIIFQVELDTKIMVFISPLQRKLNIELKMAFSFLLTVLLLLGWLPEDGLLSLFFHWMSFLLPRLSLPVVGFRSPVKVPSPHKRHDDEEI